MNNHHYVSWIVWYVTVLHISWAIQMLLIKTDPQDLHGGAVWNVYAESGGLVIWAYIMIISSILTVISDLFSPARRFSLALMLPQQFVLTIGAVGVVTGLLGISHPFETSRMLRVNSMTGWTFFFHTLAIIDLHVDGLISRSIWGVYFGIRTRRKLSYKKTTPKVGN